MVVISYCYIQKIVSIVHEAVNEIYYIMHLDLAFTQTPDFNSANDLIYAIVIYIK